MGTPTLMLDFARTRRLDPRITFTRASTGTYFDSTGTIKTAATNEARFGHDPSTLESKGLLVEEARTNLQTYSEQFDNAAWTVIGVGTITADAVTAPDGTTTADKLYEGDSTSSSHGVQTTTAPTVTAGSTMTATVYAKAGERTFCRLQVVDAIAGTNTFYAYFELAGSGTVSSVSYGGAGSSGTASITSVGNGWYRLAVSGITGGSDTRPRVVVYTQTSLSGSAVYAGTAGYGIYIWGAQLEAGAFPTSYIPTTSATVTRSADVVSMTGTNFSSWYNQTEGTVVCKATPITTSGTRPLFRCDDGTANEIISVRGNTTNPELYIVDGGVDQAQIDAGTITANTAYTIAAAYKLNDCAASQNGATAVTDTAATIPTPTQTRIGSDGTNYANGAIARLAYFNTRLTDSELKELSATSAAGDVPTLQLNFAQSKFLDPRITFTRASTGTYFDSTGTLKTAATNEARFDHDPSTLESKGLLIEESRTNYVRYNRDLTQVARWTATNVTVAKDATGIDGVTNSACTLTATSTNGTVLQTIPGSAGSATRISSAYVKRKTGSGTVEFTQDNGATWTAVTVTSAWTRVELASATVASPVVGFRIATSADAIYVDFVQHETASFSTSAIEVSADSDVTRSADVASMTGTNFSSWYNQTEGTVVVKWHTANQAGTQAIVSINNNSSTERLRVVNTSASQVRFSSITGNSETGAMNSNTTVSGSAVAAGAYALNNDAFSINGGAVITDASVTSPVVTQMTVGQDFSSNSILNGTIARLTYYPKRLGDTTLQTLSGA